MALGLISKENLIQISQMEDIEEYIQFIQMLDENEKREFHGFLRGMQTMKEIMAGNTQKTVV